MPKWTELRQPEPVEGNDVVVVLTGTIIWFTLFLAQLPFHDRLADDGRGWWLWSCLAGTGLGLFGLWYVKRRNR